MLETDRIESLTAKNLGQLIQSINVKNVITCIAMQFVIVRPRLNGIVTVPTMDHTGAIAVADNSVITLVTEDGVVAFPGVEEIIPGTAIQNIVLVSAQNMVVAAHTTGDDNAGEFDALYGCFSTDDGSQLWVRQVGTSSPELSNPGAVIHEGTVFALLTTEGYLGQDENGANAGGRDAVVLRLDLATGADIWREQYGTLGDDKCSGLAVDPDGETAVVSCFMSGSYGGAHAGFWDVVVMRIRLADGSRVWARQYGTSEQDIAHSVSLCGGAIFLGGETRGALGAAPQGNWDAFLMRLTRDGELEWARQFGGEGHESLPNIACAAAGDGSSRVIGVGDTMSALMGPRHFGSSDVFVAVFDAGTGDVVSSVQVGTPEREVSWGCSEVVDGAMAVGGQTLGQLGQSSAGNDDMWFGLVDVAAMLG